MCQIVCVLELTACLLLMSSTSFKILHEHDEHIKP